MNIGLARNQSCRFLMFGAAILKASAGEARTQRGQTHLHRKPKGDSWVYIPSMSDPRENCLSLRTGPFSRRSSPERIEWEEDRT